MNYQKGRIKFHGEQYWSYEFQQIAVKKMNQGF